MKKYSITAVIIFVISYLVFAIVNLPASWLVSKLSLPKAVTISGVSGSVWHSRINAITWQQWQVNQLEIKLNFSSLITFSPSAQVSFEGAANTDAQGQGQITLSQQPVLSDWVVDVTANDIAQQLILPVPAQAAGQAQLSLARFELGKPVCQLLQGKVYWQRAAVSAMEQNIELGNMQAELSCEQGAVAVKVDPKNPLGLAVTGYYRGGQQVSVNGYLTPGADFPEPLKQVLPFLGQADNQGRYRINF